MRVLVLVNINLLTRFEVPHLTPFKDIMGAQNFKMGQVTLTTSI